MIDLDIAIDLPEVNNYTGRNHKDYLIKLREAHALLINAAQNVLLKN